MSKLVSIVLVLLAVLSTAVATPAYANGPKVMAAVKTRIANANDRITRAMDRNAGKIVIGSTALATAAVTTGFVTSSTPMKLAAGAVVVASLGNAAVHTVVWFSNILQNRK